MKQLSPTLKQVPLDIVGSTVFGRYQKISIEQTFNMIISDEWLVPYAGYRKVATIAQNGVGRGIYSSIKYGHIICVVDNGVYSVNTNGAVSKIGSINTFDGDVFISENNASQIAICDKSNIYIFNYANNTFSQANTSGFIPGYIAFQNEYFIAPDLATSQWRLSALSDGTSWPFDSNHVGTFETKPDIPIAAIPFPGKGNLLFIFGSIVTENWTDTGQQLFPYQKNTYFDIDYGCLNAATIAYNENMIVWLAANERSGPTVMYTTGSDPIQISNDGINFKLAQLTAPQDAYGFLFRQDGHLIYQFTFYTDNLSFAYDFNTGKIFSLSDEYMNYHIAKRVVFFNNNYYFVSINDGNLYEMSTNFTAYDGREIPRIRVCKNIRMPDSSRFVIPNLTFTLEQGANRSVSRVDLCWSKNGGESFGSFVGKDLNLIGHRQNRLNFWGCGFGNDFVPQFRFWSEGRFVCYNGVVSIYQ